MTDWSGVPLNTSDAPVGHVSLTPQAPPGIPFFVDATAILTIEETGCGTVVGLPAGRISVKENIREVFRRKAQANTVSAPALVDRIRKKA